MSNDLWRWVIGLAVLGHGIGHVLFMPVLTGALRVEASGHSWLLTGVLGDPMTRALATLAAGVALVAFVAAGAGIIGQATWWRPIALAGAGVSLGLIVVMWDGLPAANAFFALAFDLVVLAVLVFAPERAGAPA